MSLWQWGKKEPTGRPIYSVSPDPTTAIFLVVVASSILAMTLLPFVQWFSQFWKN